MPIYPYRCTSCEKSKDVLQKMSDEPLKTCPFCGQDTFEKQLSAAGFQLKGQGWYASDFRNPSSGPNSAAGASNTASTDTATTPSIETSSNS
jgi:putative FmdB family regulatory protein